MTLVRLAVLGLRYHWRTQFAVVCGVAAAVAVLAGSLFATRPGASPLASRLGALALPPATLVAVALAIRPMATDHDGVIAEVRAVCQSLRHAPLQSRGTP